MELRPLGRAPLEEKVKKRNTQRGMKRKFVLACYRLLGRRAGEEKKKSPQKKKKGNKGGKGNRVRAHLPPFSPPSAGLESGKRRGRRKNGRQLTHSRWGQKGRERIVEVGSD